MKTSSKLALVALAGALATVATPEAQAKKGDMEKCYGVVKAGQNGCSNAAHSCAGHAEEDGAKDEWVMVPKGLCEKLVGGNLESE